MEGTKTRATRAARNRRKRNYTPDSSDYSEEEEEQSSHANTQLIPTPSIDSVLLNMASQALASANQASSARPLPQKLASSRPHFPPRSLVRDDSPGVVVPATSHVEEPRESIASALLGMNRTSAPRILNRQPRRLPPHPPSSVSSSSDGVLVSDRPIIRSLRVHPPSAAQPAHETLAANLAEVLKSSQTEVPTSRAMMPIIRPTTSTVNMPKRNRLSEINFRDDQFASEDASVPFCNKCANEFPSLLRNLDRLHNRINNLMAVMKSVMEKVRNSSSTAMPFQRVQPAPPLKVIGYNGTHSAIKVIPRKVPVVEQQQLSSDSDSEPQPSAKDVYLSALEKEILQVTPDKFNLPVLNELSETIKETRLTKVTTALDHLVKLRILKTVGESNAASTSSNNSPVVYKKNMKKFSELKL